MTDSVGISGTRTRDDHETLMRLQMIRRLIRTWRDGHQPDVEKLLEGIDGLASSAEEWLRPPR